MELQNAVPPESVISIVIGIHHAQVFLFCFVYMVLGFELKASALARQMHHHLSTSALHAKVHCSSMV
jgi:hypothetical protein